jgi:anti-sigma factor RsiW
MNCEQAKELFSEMLIGSLDDSARAELEAHLKSCPLCREETMGLQSVWEKLAALPEGQPGTGLDGRVKATIEAYQEGIKHGAFATARRQTLVGWLGSLWPKQPALQFAMAILFFVLGFFIGPRIARTQRDNAGTSTSNQPGVAQLREEIASTKQLVALSLLQQPSASERLRGVEWASGLNDPNEQVLASLLRVLELDSNINVRLAVVDTLQQFVQNPRVRTGLIQALARPQSPLVQIDLIHVMVRLKEKDSVVVLKALLQDADINPTVRERAEWALQKLS